ncbi:MAG: hypothetical protein U5L95_03575 [Candidatus Saccharibacteria bacterium]|nr:hypothetical protein [Candidatus Saccharibacteria bacterium]
MHNLKRFISSVLLIALVGGVLLALWHKQDVYDWYRLRDYVPSAEIEALAENTAMSDYGRKLFYVHDPRLEDRETFNRTCSHFEQTIVLGCYKSHQSIHVFDVQDERLEGIEEVTAAHEMLHAAYDRLDDSGKKRIDRMVVSHYENVKKDLPRIRDTVLTYIESDDHGPEVVNNELHSIMGTEVRELSPELEEYYGQYFEDRTRVVEHAEGYAQVFVEQQNKIEDLRGQIQQLETKLQGRRAEIESEGQSLQEEARRLTELRANDQIEEYNASVLPYNQRLDAYRVKADQFNADIRRLNDLIERFNELAVEQKELNNALDSSTPNL